MAAAELIAICDADALFDGAIGVRFHVSVAGRPMTGFVVRWQGRCVAYLNQCSHVAMELDWQPGQFFDSDGHWLVCATHGALYAPDTGRCAGGPCAGRGGLRRIEVIERDGTVYWRPDNVVRRPLSGPAGAS